MQVPRPNSANVGIPLANDFSSGVSAEVVVVVVVIDCLGEHPPSNNATISNRIGNTQIFLLTFTP